MTDKRELFERQAAWQAGRRHLSWPKKVRMAEAIRESLIRLRSTHPLDPKKIQTKSLKAPTEIQASVAKKGQRGIRPTA